METEQEKETPGSHVGDETQPPSLELEESASTSFEVGNLTSRYSAELEKDRQEEDDSDGPTYRKKK